MNPYLQIIKAYLNDGHFTTEDLEMLLSEIKRPTPKKMTKEQEEEKYYMDYFNKHL